MFLSILLRQESPLTLLNSKPSLALRELWPAVRFLLRGALANTKQLTVMSVVLYSCALGRNRTCIASTANLNSIH